MSETNSYAGKILRVDLTTGKISSEPLNMDWARHFIGGKGLGFRYLFDALSANVNPLSPANVIGLFPGALAGTCVATTARTAVFCRSPATGTILDSYVGGAFGLQLKLAGYDGVIITGRASRPSYLLILDDRVEIRDAAPMWGKGIWETDTWMKEQAGDEHLVSLTAGPAGENLISFACLTSEAYRQAGRGGAGAVFGSKNLKAVAARGTGAIHVPDMQSFMKMYYDIFKNHLLTSDNLWTYSDGTPMIVDLSQTTGLLPTRGFSQGVFEGAEGINSAAIQARKSRNRACATCPLACGQLTRNADGLMEGPEYETLGLGGANCGMGDLEAVIAFNRLCDNLGLDTISTGNVIGLAMLMAQEGIHDFGVHFGNVKEYLAATENIAYLRGVGAELAQGARHIAQKYGAEHLVMESKGLEFPGYDPRGSYGMALAYCTADRGGCHMRAFPIANEAFGDGDPFTLEGKAAMVAEMQNSNSAKWTGIFCDFWAISIEDITKLISAGTGHTYTEEEMITVGERIWNLGRIFNVREGFSRKDDYPPSAIFDRALPEGPAAGKNFTREEYDAALSEYYRLRGWTEDGVPTEEKLEALGLADLVRY
jgi:aldehyde:ferredoxin oxidoreductase